MTDILARLGVIVILLSVGSCRPGPADVESPAPTGAEAVLQRVGSVTITQSDLDYHLRERHDGRDDAATRELALAELTRRAQVTQAALDEGMDEDPVVRAEMAQLLGARLREMVLTPRLQALAAEEIPEARLREIYQEQVARFQAGEKREVAVLWLDPGADPGRAAQYVTKLQQAREWFAKDETLVKQPGAGFSVLSVDYSEHAASRFKGGVVGWMERAGGMDPWSKAVAEIVFTLKMPGEVSAVVSRPEGVFLVRYMALKSAVQRPFEAVRGELEHSERQRRREAVKRAFEDEIEKAHPVEPDQR